MESSSSNASAPTNGSVLNAIGNSLPAEQKSSKSAKKWDKMDEALPKRFVDIEYDSANEEEDNDYDPANKSRNELDEDVSDEEDTDADITMDDDAEGGKPKRVYGLRSKKTTNLEDGSAIDELPTTLIDEPLPSRENDEDYRQFVTAIQLNTTPATFNEEDDTEYNQPKYAMDGDLDTSMKLTRAQAKLKNAELQDGSSIDMESDDTEN